MPRFLVAISIASLFAILACASIPLTTDYVEVARSSPCPPGWEYETGFGSEVTSWFTGRLLDSRGGALKRPRQVRFTLVRNPGKYQTRTPMEVQVGEDGTFHHPISASTGSLEQCEDGAWVEYNWVERVAVILQAPGCSKETVFVNWDSPIGDIVLKCR